MTDQNNNFNEFSELINWMNESNLFETRRKDNIKILPELNNQVVENKSSSQNKATESEKNDLNKNDKVSNKKPKCSMCNVKISLVDELVSTCKCQQKYCAKHRMPEAHLCSKLEEMGKEQRKNLELSLVKLDSKCELIKF